MTIGSASAAADPATIGPSWRRERGRWVLPARTLGWEVLGWTARWLCQPDGPDAGQPWRYTDEQARLILWWYALDERGRFTHRYGVLRRIKGWGKDPFAASLAAVELIGPCRFAGWSADGAPVSRPHPAAWVQVAAVSREQTRNTMTLFPGLFSRDCIAEYGVDIGKEIIYARAGRCRIEAVTSSPRALEGGRATYVIANETHHWLVGNDGHDMMRVIRRNLGKARDASARALSITNAHLPGEDSVGERDWLAEETRHNAGRASDVLYDSLEAPSGLEADEPADVRAGILAARGDSVWLDIDRTAAEFMDPQTSFGEASRFYWNRIEGSDAAWVDPAAWRRCAEQAELPDGERVALGFDGSLRDDSTALVACRLADGHLTLLNVWEKPHGPTGDGWQVPRTEVDAAVASAFARFKVARFYCDPPHWQDYVDKWAGEHGDKIVLEFWTMSRTRMAKALERLHTAIVGGEITHDDDPVLSRHVLRAIARTGPGGTQVSKRKDADKIDALVAACLAYEARNDAIAAGALVTPRVAFVSWSELDDMASV